MRRSLLDRLRAAAGVALGLLVLTAAIGSARAAFPDRPITIVVPFDPGGSLDLHARAVAQVMQRLVGQNVLVVNRRGAVGSIGLQSVANAKPDGYTIVATPLPIVTNPEVDKLFDRAPAFSTDAFTPLCLLSNDPLVLVVRDESRWRSLDALIAAARGAPGAIKYSSPGPYGSVHLATELFADQAGIKLLHVPFTGTAPSLNALLTGEVDLFFAPTTTAIAQVEGGRLRALAVTGEARFANLPAVPTVAESGYPNLVTNWYALFAHRDTPAPELGVLRGALDRMGADPEFAALLAKTNTIVDYRPADRLQAFVVAQHATLARLIAKLGRID